MIKRQYIHHVYQFLVTEYVITVYDGYEINTRTGNRLMLKAGDAAAAPIHRVVAMACISFPELTGTDISRHDIAKSLWNKLRPRFHAKRREMGLAK